jgi:hypothetical protein
MPRSRTHPHPSLHWLLLHADQFQLLRQQLFANSDFWPCGPYGFDDDEGQQGGGGGSGQLADDGECAQRLLRCLCRIVMRCTAPTAFSRNGWQGDLLRNAAQCECVSAPRIPPIAGLAWLILPWRMCPAFLSLQAGWVHYDTSNWKPPGSK